MPSELCTNQAGIGLWVFCIFNFLMNVIIARAFIKYMATLENAMMEILKSDLRTKELEDLHNKLRVGKFLLMLLIVVILSWLSLAMAADNLVSYVPVNIASDMPDIMETIYDGDPWLQSIYDSNFYTFGEENSSLCLLSNLSMNETY